MRKWWRRAVALPKPARSAIASTVSSVSSSSCWASRMRCPVSQRCGVVPVSERKRRGEGGAGVGARGGEGALGRGRAGGQLADGERVVQVGAQPFQQVAQGAVAGRGDGLHHVLSL